MTYKATFRKGLTYRVGDEVHGHDAPVVTVNIIAPSPMQAEVNARRIAAERGWTFIDMEGG